MVARMFPLRPSVMYSLWEKATPSSSPQPTRKSLPGPWTTLVGMQFLTVKLLMTTGPFGFPSLGSISSMVPTVRSPVAFALVTRKWPVLVLKAEPPIPAGEMAPEQFPAGVNWLQNAPAKVRIGPWWQGTFLPPAPTPVPETPEGAEVKGAGQGKPAP